MFHCYYASLETRSLTTLCNNQKFSSSIVNLGKQSDVTIEGCPSLNDKVEQFF